MSYSRQQAIEYLDGEYSVIGDAANIRYDDSNRGYKPILDNALRALGIAENSLNVATVEDTDISKYQTLLRAYALKKYMTNLAIEHDIQTGVPSINAKRSQLYTQVRQLYLQAKTEAETIGYNIESDEYTTTYLYVDYIG